MNKVTILLILSCVAVYVQAVGRQQQLEHEILKKCFARVGLDLDKISEEAKTMSEDEFLDKIGSYKSSCIETCFLELEANKVPVKQYMLDKLDKAEAQNPDAEMIEFITNTRKCLAQVDDDCLLTQCLQRGP